MIVDITILNKLNSRDFRNEPIQFKENIELDELKDEIEKIIKSQISQGELDTLLKSKHIHIENKNLIATFRIL